MKPNEIRAALLLLNVRPAEIAKRLKVSRAAVSSVISGNLKSARIQEAIANIIGKKIEEIWPEMAA